MKKLGLGMTGLSRCTIVARESAERLQLAFDGERHVVHLATRGDLHAALSHDGGPDAQIEWEWPA